MEIIIGIFMQFFWPIILGLLGLLGVLGYGAKKKADGRKAERVRAREARDEATEQAGRIREKATAKPIDQKRKEVAPWER